MTMHGSTLTRADVERIVKLHFQAQGFTIEKMQWLIGDSNIDAFLSPSHQEQMNLHIEASLKRK